MSTIQKLRADPRYAALVRRRNRFCWLLAAIVCLAYYGFIALIAFDKPLLGHPIGSGVTSIGIPVGLGLIALIVALTGLYVWRANSRYDAEMAAIIADAEQ